MGRLLRINQYVTDIRGNYLGFSSMLKFQELESCSASLVLLEIAVENTKPHPSSVELSYPEQDARAAKRSIKIYITVIHVLSHYVDYDSQIEFWACSENRLVFSVIDGYITNRPV